MKDLVGLAGRSATLAVECCGWVIVGGKTCEMGTLTVFLCVYANK